MGVPTIDVRVDDPGCAIQAIRHSNERLVLNLKRPDSVDTQCATHRHGTQAPAAPGMNSVQAASSHESRRVRHPAQRGTPGLSVCWRRLTLPATQPDSPWHHFLQQTRAHTTHAPHDIAAPHRPRRPAGSLARKSRDEHAAGGTEPWVEVRRVRETPNARWAAREDYPGQEATPRNVLEGPGNHALVLRLH